MNEEQEKNIENFLETKIEKLAPKSYSQLKSFLEKEYEILEKNEDEIVEYFKLKSKSMESLNKWITNVKMYRQHHKRSFGILECELTRIREQRTQERFETLKPKVEVNIKEELTELEEFYKELKENTPSLRSDLSTVKIKNFNKEMDNYINDDEIVFNTLVKKNGKMTIKITNEKLLEKIKTREYKNDYLLDYEIKDRNNYECILCKKVFGIGLSDYRSNYMTKKFEGVITPREVLKRAFEVAKECNTSIEMIYQYYLTE